MATRLPNIQMFKSARIQLTLFYLAVLVCLSLILTFSIRILAEQEYLHSNRVQRGELGQIILRIPNFGRWPSDDFRDVQQEQEARVRRELNQDMVFINVVALLAGGVLSYWFAGRTLRPIQEAHQAQARFAADASHELRTPLTNLRLENELFLRQKQFHEHEARDLIRSNLEEVQRLEGLAANLLALTQYGQAPLTLGPVAIRQAGQAAVKLAGPQAAAKHTTITVELAPATVQAHRDSLVQLIGILLDNAIKYGPAKGVVTVGGRKTDGQYELWVEDTGPGIAQHDLPHIFDRLYRGDTARTGKNGGYGLGLSLAKAIAEASAIDIRAANTGGGARFSLRIPLR